LDVRDKIFLLSEEPSYSDETQRPLFSYTACDTDAEWDKSDQAEEAQELECTPQSEGEERLDERMGEEEVSDQGNKTPSSPPEKNTTMLENPEKEGEEEDEWGRKRKGKRKNITPSSSIPKTHQKAEGQTTYTVEYTCPRAQKIIRKLVTSGPGGRILLTLTSEKQADPNRKPARQFRWIRHRVEWKETEEKKKKAQEPRKTVKERRSKLCSLRRRK